MAYQFTELEKDFGAIADRLSLEFASLNTGRASPLVLDMVQVESYGSRMPIKNVASVSIEDPKTLRVAPWDSSLIKEIEKAIQAANLGLSLATDEAGLRVIFPQLTTESRQRLVKTLKERLEESRINIRRSREGVWDDIQTQEKDGKMSEDDKFRAKEDLQKRVDAANKKLEEMYEKKEKEVLEG
jgi:ribosome recycling factor